ncbi:MAG: LiaI-LiaF-like domain-containing protein [Candidatus Aminicenantaceae bacterium]
MEEKVIVHKRPPKSPGLAGVISFFFPSFGALYNGQILKWIVYLIIFAVLITMQEHGEIQPFFGLILAAFYIYQIVDAVQTSKAINRRAISEEKGEAEEKIEEIPQAFKSGSIFWGAFLMALGIVFLLANFEVIDYSTVFDFWPLAVIVIGIKLVLDYFSRK